MEQGTRVPSFPPVTFTPAVIYERKRAVYTAPIEFFSYGFAEILFFRIYIFVFSSDVSLYESGIRFEFRVNWSRRYTNSFYDELKKLRLSREVNLMASLTALSNGNYFASGKNYSLHLSELVWRWKPMKKWKK